MPKARKHQIALEATPYYHCVTRCVRRAFLCGTDSITGQCFEHRRQWLEDRILTLAQTFAIDVAAYAVMSNHYHVVLHINKIKSLAWTDREVCERWHQLFKGTVLTQKFLRGEPMANVELEAVKYKLAEWRLNLCSISWFMRLVNEPIARQANTEDHCTGKFWEARFKSQALCDEKALAACMAYVDLNPIRARMAATPETSDHTSVKKRIEVFKETQQQPKSLMSFIGNPREPMPDGLPFPLKDYLELVDWTGRIIREDKRGSIPSSAPPILDRLAIEPKHWLFMSTQFESKFKGLVGCAFKVKQAAEKLGYSRPPGIGICKTIFS